MGLDTELVVRARGGDRAAFATLASAMGDRMQSAADAIVRDRAIAEDATQQALIEIWRDLPQLRDPERFEAWAYRVLVRTCYAEGRRVRRWLPNVLVDADSQDAGTGDLARVLDRDQLDRAFRRLTVEQRAVIVLHHYLDMSRPDVAQALGVPIGTVHSRLRLALTAMRAAIEADARVPARTLLPQEVVR